jgi:hypothetical protein
MESFLLEQLERLEETVDATLKWTESADLHQSTAQDLDDERQRWEAEKQQEWERIQSDAARLAEAWQRVEMEQRRLLAERNASRVSSPVDRGLPGKEGNTSAGGIPGLAGSPLPCQRDSQPTSEEPLLAPESAILQFQQLRREMQKHSQREP